MKPDSNVARSMVIPVMLAAFLVQPANALVKCTDPRSGRITYSDTACATTQHDTKMEWKPKGETNVVNTPARIAEPRPNAKIAASPEAAQLLSAYGRWIDADDLASSTPRISLPGPIAALQAIDREVAALQVPACMTRARTSLAKLTKASTEAHLTFLRRESLTSTVYQLVDRGELIRDFESQVLNARCE